MKLCMFHQYFLTNALDRNGQLPWFSRQHINRCHSCCALWNQLNTLHLHLHAQGKLMRQQTSAQPLPEPLPTPIFTRERVTSMPRVAQRIWRPLASLAAAALLIAVAVHFIWLAPPASKPGAGQSLSELHSKIVAWQQTSLTDPLEQELQGLIDSAVHVGDYLSDVVKIKHS